MPTHKRVVLLEEFFEFNLMLLVYPLKSLEYALLAHRQFFSSFTIHHTQINVDSSINAKVNSIGYKYNGGTGRAPSCIILTFSVEILLW